MAWDVHVTPAAPQLGETVSVVVETQTDPAPQLFFNQQPYPLFPLGAGRFRALLPTTPFDRPGSRTLEVRAEGQVRQVPFTLVGRAFPTQSIWLPPDKEDIEGTNLEFDRIDAFKRLFTPQKFWNGPFLKPTSGEVTTVYGVLRYYNGKFADDYYHRGVDYAAATGTPVIAPAAGRVGLVGYERQGFELNGNTIGLDHGQGVLSLFIHLNTIEVQEGQMVQAGQRIGTVGSTGIATGPNLHWGLYVGGQSVDPVPWRFGNVE
jgi:murein DD-endopeptidase MepM/ murein hydrolase activator NlpD